ncbi:alkaline phosphatase family protein [Desulfovibrio sp. JC022]|uniref:alkaline phosphatase family protein n=1 Tax=Desulfovibrio sp. JC022 TaxID=2593642 RepID=UPI0013D38251|nr:alkaline phosphatase family protein [Desulfovibrio sp. JC022]NDV21754.1 phosphodiesterase [Desulfovibrio sp. JC022]
MFFKQKERKRLVVLGLDGLPASLALQWATKLPNLGRIAGKCEPISAELPELSPVNWTSFFTAQKPEKHGLYGFTSIDPQNYTLSINNFEQVLCPTIFDALGEKGLVSKIINLPNTYPAKSVRGMLISGFVADSLEKAVQPPFLLGPLRDAGYQLEADTSRGIMDPDYLFDQVALTLERRLKALEMFWNDLAWDLFTIVFTETDRLFHFFYPAFEDENHPLYPKAAEFMHNWDRAIGIVLDKFEALPGDKKLIAFADHGFAALETEVDLNTFLVQHGYLEYTQPAKDQWDSTIISPSSKAFALDPGRIYIHTSDRFGRGQVSPEQAMNIASEIAAKLMLLEFNGQKIMDSVQTTREAYGVNPIGDPPDLICTARPGFDLKAKFDRVEIFGFHGRTGTHTVKDAFFYSSDGQQISTMHQTGQIILDWFNITLTD